MKIDTYLANGRNYGGKRNLSNIKYIVVHYTGNDGDTDIANAKYFRNNIVEVSAHYFVDDDSITQSVPDNYVAWHCGSSKYYCEARNTNSIGIELCDTVKDGKYNLSAQTRANAIWLIKYLMKKYNIDTDHIVRHYDVSRKRCPAYFVTNSSAWEKFKRDCKSETQSNYNGAFPVLPGKGFLAKGDTGTEVRKLQSFLKWYGYNIDVDGDFGDKTRYAVKLFQKSVGVTVDGLFGQKSLAKAKAATK